ncbi:MAG: TetR/AcrR family transcriptional regulator [Lachnospiraceae bacterium]|nr:TetR/AcrR family transcriptional regulator [Lachnospiraceae bacterium]
MNEKFFTLPIEKQNAIINAGYRVFSQNTYKHSPMSEIANAAGISKSLLFHYFHNKKELYLFLWNTCAETTVYYLKKYGCYEQTDMFESMYLGMKAKMEMMKLYPHVSNFAIKAFYEKEPEICTVIHESYNKHLALKREQTMIDLNPNQFISGLDISMMYQEMYWASEGYLWEKVQWGNMEPDQLEKDFIKLINFWKSIYLKKE